MRPRRWPRSPWLSRWVAAALALGGAIAFAALFEVNLHCTQYASLGNAVLDPEPHPEEAQGVDGRPTPAVYRFPLGWFLRGYLGLAVMVSLLLPVVAALRGAVSRMTLSILLGGALWPVANSAVLGSRIAGERFVAVGYAAGAVTLCLGAVVALVLRWGGGSEPAGWRRTIV